MLTLVWVRGNICCHRTIHTSPGCDLYWPTPFYGSRRICHSLLEAQSRLPIDTPANHANQECNSRCVECSTCTEIRLRSSRYPVYVGRPRFFSNCSVNGKKVEIAVKQIVCGNKGVQVSGTVGNPESLEEYRQFVEVEKVHAERNRSARL